MFLQSLIGKQALCVPLALGVYCMQEAIRIIVTGQCYVSLGDIGCPLRGDVLAVSLWLYGDK